VRLGRDGALTEIEVASPSLASGYFADPARTAERFQDGFFRTGDLGFLRDGRLYVVGRHDDMISVAGRNVYAREIETAVDRLPSVRTGCTTIVDVPDGPGTRLVMLTELRDGAGDYAQLTASAARIATATAGVSLSECVFLPKGMLPKTPSGKIQRFRCRQLVSAQTLEPLARVSVRGGLSVNGGGTPSRAVASPEARAA
jgi:acyl-CoA synthetase (AMP-forming)/AMP-acid ligase II